MNEIELMKHWLWMQTMEYALNTLKRKVQPRLYPKETYSEWKNLGWQEMQRVIFTYILEYWETPEHEGLYNGNGTIFETGCDLTAQHSGITGKYKQMEVTISWSEVRQFIKKMLAGEPDKQLNLFELLAKEAMR